MESNENGDNGNRNAPPESLEIIVKREQNDDFVCEINNMHNQNETQNSSNENQRSGVKRKSEENPLNMQEDDRVSEVDTDSNVLVKRPRYSESQCDESLENSNDIVDANSLQIKEETVNYTLYVSNSPGEWTSQQIIDFIKDECGINISRINDSRAGNTNSDFQIKLKFPNKEQSTKVYDKLKEMEAAGKLRVHTDDDMEETVCDIQSTSSAQIDERASNRATSDPPEPRVDFELASGENSFYIREEYLESLGIILPLTNWVTVTNFRCDKTELKEVFELAGRVLVCSVYSMTNKYANIMYSHPLEAVQAISMLNGQKLFGQTLKVTMNNSRDTNTLLPKGLADVGPGLGKYGKGLPDLVEQFKRFVKGQTSSIDAHLFQPELLRDFGVDAYRETPTPFVRSAPSESSSVHIDNVSEQGSDVSACESVVRNNGNLFGAIGQRVSHASTPAPASVQLHNNRVSTFTPMSQPLIIRGTNSNMMPIPSGSMQRPRQMAPISNPLTIYANCPPIAGVDTSNSARGFNISVIGSGNMPVLPGPIITRGPMPSPMAPMRRPVPVTITHLSTANRFPAPGPRNVGPVTGPPRGPAPVRPNPSIQITNTRRSNGPILTLRPYMSQATTGSNVQMIKGADAVTVQISGLPPSTNFVNLGQSLSEFGNVLFLEFTTPGCAVVRFASPSDADRCLRILL
ncbi:uncharacterized protein LOC125067728 isoform X2 [Vanessa atalanta]|uniref:uncharacterized protein LOC125067728 isoform X2 n=1 Tax=Vanessa atalanta TaxID=42275 RepID=UPI001FCCD022|nr:uncharacterized protein LOC125067728 isoform X2 [Vanessa atalanta]